ncbi:restriction endonuclease subunit S [Flavisolibacter sp. BT320]|nr:restriction endonuclease subunit S [Flavisolibacter longurius]
MKEEQTINGLPNHWKEVKLGELCVRISNGANAKQVDEKVGFPISRIETIWNEQIDLDRVKYIEENDSAFVEKYALKKNDLLFSHINSDTHLGKTAIFKNQTNTLIHGINLLLIRFKEEVSADFLNYQFKYKRKKGEFISIAQKSVNQSSINQAKLKNLDFILPPLKEQHQIVSKIEELFSELDKGIEELKTAQQQLKVYRQAVLKWAFEGKLTNEDVTDGELPEGWKWEVLSEVSDISGGLTKNSKREGLQLKLPFLRVANVYFNELDLSEVHTIGIKETEIERVKLVKDDLLFVEGNGSLDQIGRVALWNGVIENCVHQNHLIKARLSNEVIPKYALYFFLSTSGREKIKQQANSTSGLHTLSLSKISKLEMPICSIEEQQQIVQEIESRLSVCDKIEETITDSLKQAAALRQSILKKAFEGKLV